MNFRKLKVIFGKNVQAGEIKMPKKELKMKKETMTIGEFKQQYARGELTIDYLKRVVDNPNTPPEILQMLYKDKNPQVKAYVAENPNTPLWPWISNVFSDNVLELICALMLIIMIGLSVSVIIYALVGLF